MVGQRLKLFRLAKSLSQDQLVELTGGYVTKAAVSKYERGQSNPSIQVLNKLAKALEIKPSVLLTEPPVKVNFIGYRKGSGLSGLEENRVEAQVTTLLEECVKLRSLTQKYIKPQIPVKKIDVNKIEDAEIAAESIRGMWKLGVDPISSVTSMLEDKSIFVFNIKAHSKFDGISACAYGPQSDILAAAVISQKDIPGERQRLNLAHELGHLILNVSGDVDEEKAAFAFAGALLAPKEILYKEIGVKRTRLSFRELFLLKCKLGISVQALIYRLLNLDIISKSYMGNLFALINKLGWKKHEPNELSSESPHWLDQNVYKALTEGLISIDKAKYLLGEIENFDSEFPKKHRAFMSLSSAERNKLLADQAKKVISDFEIDKEWLEMGLGYGS